MNLELLTKQVANLSRAIGTYIKNEIRRLNIADIKSKGINDFVTYVDQTSEKRLVSELGKLLPEAGFIVEETPELEEKDHYNWIIDPLDGTTNFIHGVPLFSISIALLENNRLISGVIYEVNLQECFYAWQKGGAYLNGHKIKVSAAKTLKDSLIATGFPYSDFSRLDAYTEVFLQLMKSTHGIRRLGSAAVDLAYVSCGRYEGFYEYGLNSWDVAAGAIIVEEAGGKVSDFKGENEFLNGREMLATNPGIYDEFLSLLQSKFK